MVKSFRTSRSQRTNSSTASTLPVRNVSQLSRQKTLSRSPNREDETKDDPKGPLGLRMLHCPSEPLIEFIFVHGLGGGSRKTWSKSPSIAHYWPQEWLPRDSAFKNVRIHSYGYNSDYINGKENVLDVHHFGKSFLGEISTSPHLYDSETPIVLIGHSMGGLVIKKAFILAKQDPNYDDLSRRFHSIYFLATPHGGSDLAKFLDNILDFAFSSRHYVVDLKKNSAAIRSINDEFRRYSDDVDLWSFYETVKLRLGWHHTLIVEPEAAVLGYEKEKQMPMNADHRSICKFETVHDPNYIIIRNSLAATVNLVSKLVMNSKRKLWQAQLDNLTRYLDISGKLDEDLISVEETRLPGTCTYFTRNSSFVDWKEWNPDVPSILWVNSKPGSGKSVLAGYIIGRLLDTNADCSYFFFKHGDKSKSNLSALLRHIAFQMACASIKVRDALLRLQNDGVKFELDNERSIWRTLFLQCIFETEFPIHYWVIDALDECIDCSTFLETMLAKLEEPLPIRILITSRKVSEIEKPLSGLGPSRVRVESISTADTLPDMKLLIEAKAKTLVTSGDQDNSELIEKVMEKSEGSFLWTVLVLNELSNVHSEEDINQVLDEVPQHMEPLYQRTLQHMSQNSRGLNLTKAILSWVTCVTRPLTVKELEGALKLDIKDSFPRLEESVATLCGQLVNVDKHGRVHMVHETAREFLLRDDLDSEFAVVRSDAHTRIARTSLRYLASDEMKPPRSGRRGSAMINMEKRSEFSRYACGAFPYHLSKADPLADDVLVLVDKFLRTNILSWIDVTAQSRSLVPLVRAAKQLKKYLNACTTERGPLGKELATIRGWTTDLIRLAAKFSDALIALPSAIYSLILPFCPTGSTVYKTVSQGRRLSILGHVFDQWDDRLTSIDFHHGQTSAVGHGEDFFAVGLTNGTINLYYATSCQEYKSFNHGESVRFLVFHDKNDLLASCGLKMIYVWHVRTGEIVHTLQSPLRPIALTFDSDMLIVASYRNFLAFWDLATENVEQSIRPWNNTGQDLSKPFTAPPSAISISVSHKVMAIAYVGLPIVLWDLEEDSYYGSSGKKLSSGETTTHRVTALAFNPNPASDVLLAASYLDGELVLLDPLSDQELCGLRADCPTLTASPDGRFLAGGTGGGIINIFEFDTLRLLYRIRSSNYHIKQMTFSSDGFHFADIRGSQCNIWEPAILLRDMVGDDSSEKTSNSVVEAVAMDTKIKISVMALHDKGDVVFCGKDDGSVVIYDIKTGKRVRDLYRHKSGIRFLTWWSQSDTIMSVDRATGVHAYKLVRNSREGWVIKDVFFQKGLDCGQAITQILPGEAVGKFILSTREADHLWSMEGEAKQEQVRIYPGKPGSRRWFQELKSPKVVMCIKTDDNTLRTFNWDDWLEIRCISLDVFSSPSGIVQPKNVYIYNVGKQNEQEIIVEYSELNGSATTCGVQRLDLSADGTIQASAHQTFDFGKPPTEQELQQQHQQLKTLSDQVTHIINVSDAGKIIFLDRKSWVCSADLENLGNDKAIVYLRHFFVPYDWFSGIRDVICAAYQRDVILARNDDVAVIKGGLDFMEDVVIEFETAVT